MTGFRLAKGGVQEIERIVPDLTALGKIIGGGLPVGAFGGRAEIMDRVAPLGPVYQAGTLSGNPLALAAGIAALEMLEEAMPYAGLDALGRRVRSALEGACREKGLAAQVPQTGSMFSIFFTPQPVRDYAGALTGDAKIFARFFRGCLDAGSTCRRAPTRRRSSAPRTRARRSTARATSWRRSSGVSDALAKRPRRIQRGPEHGPNAA